MGAAVGFVLVGWLASGAQDGSFDWELASIFGTAVGTVLLALATGALAVSTARDVTATQEIAWLTREEQEDRLRPVVMGTVTGFEPSEALSDILKVELVNIGGGPAVRVEVTGEYVGEMKRDVTFSKRPVAALAAGQSLSVEVGCVISSSKDYTPSLGDFKVRGSYLDRLQRPVARAIFDWVRDQPPAS
jgi:hypothetical protein